MPLTAKLSVLLEARQSGAQDFGGPTFEPVIRGLLDLASGVGVNQADILFADERTITTGANDDLDLAGVLSDALGVIIASAELVALLVIWKSKAGVLPTTNLTIGLGTNPVTPGFLGGTLPTIGPIRPGGIVLLASPDAAGLGVITAGSADLLRLTNSAGASATYQIAIIARTA